MAACMVLTAVTALLISTWVANPQVVTTTELLLVEAPIVVLTLLVLMVTGLTTGMVP